MRKYFALLIIFTSLFCAACSKKAADSGPEENVDFTVVDFDNLPDEVAQIIDEKKNDEFQMSANIDGYTYVVVGYGRQEETGGYSIAVDKLVQNRDKVMIQTTLVGPAPNEAVNKMDTFPVIIVKFEQTDKIIEYL